MAASFLKEVDDELLQCAVCLKRLVDPKALPCLHRFCCKCLNDCISKSNKDQFECPMCRHLVEIPPEGAESLKSDFLTNALIEKFETAERSADLQGKVVECASCGTKDSITATCSDCDYFICSACYRMHETLAAFKNHKNVKKISSCVRDEQSHPQKPFLPQDIPKCPLHSSQPMDMSCKSCKNKQICVTCCQLHHQGHDLEAISDTAKVFWDRLIEKKKKLQDLHDFWSNAESNFMTVEDGFCDKMEILKKEVDSDSLEISNYIQERSDEAKENLHLEFKEQLDEVNKKLQQISEEKKGLESQKEKKEKDLQDKMVTEKQKISQMQEKLHQELITKSSELKEFFEVLISEKREMMEQQYKKAIAMVDCLQMPVLEELQNINKQVDITLNVMIPKKLDLEKFNRLEPRYVPAEERGQLGSIQLNLFEVEREFTVDQLDQETSTVTSMCSFGSDKVCILAHDKGCSGLLFACYSLTKLSCSYMDNEFVSSAGTSPCIACKEYPVVVIACKPLFSQLQISLYNLSVEYYDEILLSNPTDVTCIAYDNTRDRLIYAGKDKNSLYWCEYPQYSSTKLHIRESCDIIKSIGVIDDKLLVCDGTAKAFAVDWEGNFLFEFPPPKKGTVWHPIQVTCLEPYTVFILWEVVNSAGEKSKVLMQYFPDGKVKFPWGQSMPDDVTLLSSGYSKEDKERVMVCTPKGLVYIYKEKST